EPLDPQVTEIALAGFAIAIGPILAFHGRVFGVTEKFGTPTAKTLGGFDDAFASRTAGRRISGSWHLLFCPELLRDSSFSALFVYCRSFRPRSLISPAAAGQVER